MLNHPLIQKFNWVYFSMALSILICAQFLLMLGHPLFSQLGIEKLALDSAASLLLMGILLIYIVNTLGFYRPKKFVFFIILASGLILTGVWEFALDFVLDLIYTDPESDYILNQMFWYRYFYAFLIIIGTISFSWIYYQNHELREELERQKETERTANEAELYKLRQQLQPHFLFNSLNSINALIGFNPDMASKMILQLSEFFRGTLKREDKKFIPLKEEIDYLKLYLEIEQVRFGHRLQANLDIQEEAKTVLVPPLILQPMMENAIKFGLYGTIGEVNIEIKAHIQSNNLLHLTISNPYDSGGSGIKGTGFGLSAIRRRLYLLFERNDLLVTSQSEGRFIAELKLPIQHV